MSRRSLLAAPLALLLAVAMSSAAAAAPPELAVTVHQNGDGAPVSYLVVDAGPGAPAPAGVVTVRNEDERPVTVDIYPVASVTAANLGSAYALRGERRGPAAWVRASERRLSLSPGERAAVAVGVEVPAGQPDGEYLSGLAIEARGQAGGQPGDDDGVAVVNAQRHVVGVQVDVGTVRNPKLVFDGASVERQPAGVTFLIEMRNPGNAILQGVRGRVEVERDGRRVAAEPIGPGTFVSDTSIDFPVLARRENPEEGTEYRVRAVARYAGRVARLDETVSFGSEAAQRQEQFGGRTADDGFPWWWVLIALAAVAMLALAAKLRRRRLPALPETLASIDHELATNRPLALIAIGPLPADRRARRELQRSLLVRLRGGDMLCEPEPGTLVVVAGDTAAAAAAALQADLQRVAESTGTAALVRARTAPPMATAAELLAAVLVSPAPGPGLAGAAATG